MVPQSIKNEILHLCHDASTAGHLGQRKTLQRVRQRFDWPGLRRDVEEYAVVASSAFNENHRVPHQEPRSARAIADTLGNVWHSIS